MAYTNLMQFVSQAEREGVTLAEVLTRMLSEKDLEEAQSSLLDELSSNYRTIEDFMSDVSVPSIDDVLSADHAGHPEPLSISGHVLSDDNPLECD